MGFFGSGDKVNTTNQSDQRQAGADQAIVQRDAAQLGGGAGNQSTSGVTGSNVIGIGGKQVGGGSNALDSGAVQAGGNAHVDYTNQNVDTAVIAAFGGTLRDVLGTQSAAAQAQSTTLAQLVSDQADQSRNLFSDIGAKISDLAKNQQTGGETDRNKIILYVVLGVLALLGLVAWIKR